MAHVIEWTIQVQKHRSAMDRIRGRNAMAPDDPLAALIERLLRADSNMTGMTVDRAS